jgi:hypothetical protein
MRALDQREKDRQLLELDNVYEDLKKQAHFQNNDELETLTNVSMQEIKELKEDSSRKQINIYKPNLKGPKGAGSSGV